MQIDWMRQVYLCNGGQKTVARSFDAARYLTAIETGSSASGIYLYQYRQDKCKEDFANIWPEQRCRLMSETHFIIDHEKLSKN